MRIVSLLPSTTEIVFALGAGDEVVGVTFECDFPVEAKQRPIISTSAMPEGLTPSQIDAEVKARLARGDDLYTLHEGALRGLQPDLILTQDLCAVCAVDLATVDAAMDYLQCEGRVVSIDPASLRDVVDSVATIGTAIGRDREAATLIASLNARLEAVRDAVRDREPRRVLFLEWTDPPFCAGHWVPDMLEASGAVALLGRPSDRSVELTWDEVVAAAPEIVVVSPCGFRLEGARALAVELVDRAVLAPDAQVWAVDADAAFVRPGPRLVDGVEALAALCHPGALPERPELATYVASTSANTKPSRSTSSPTTTPIG